MSLSHRQQILYGRFCLANIAYLLMVIVFGAFVRATGSGAGCGSHWPLCNGDVLPRSPSVATMIEFSHRVSSGLTMPFILLLLIFAFRLYPRRHPVRFAAIAALVMIVVEALLGAGLVLFEHVADNRSSYRAISMGLHLISTFALMAATTLQWYWAGLVRARPYADSMDLSRLTFGGRDRAFFGLGLIVLLVTGLSGAITALGDTLFPVQSIDDAWKASGEVASHLFVKLRVYHPLIAVMSGGYLIWLSKWLRDRYEPVYLASLWTGALVMGQLGLGYLNVYLMAPTWLQLVHLLFAQFVWISFICMGAGGFKHVLELRLRGDNILK